MVNLYSEGLKAIEKHIQELSVGNFTYRGKQAYEFEEYNGVVESLNMLGEELEEITVSKKYLEKIFDSVPVMLLLVNESGHILDKNVQADNFLNNQGIKVNDINSLLQLFRITTAEIVESKNRMLNERKLVERTLFFERIKKYLAVKALLFNEKDKIFLFVANDITDIVNVKNQLLQSEKKFREVFNQSSDGVFTMFPGGELVEVNDAFKKITSIKHIKAKSLFKCFTSVYETHDSLEDIVKSGGAVTNHEVIFHQSKKIKQLCLLSLLPMQAENNELLYHGIIRDISLYKIRQVDFVQQLNNEQENLRRNMSFELHDSIGQQLSGIKFMLNSLSYTAENTRQKEEIDMVSANVLQALSELRSICFDLMPASLAKYGLANGLNELIKRIRNTYKDLRIDIQFADALPPLQEDLALNIYRIIQELINNAVKHANCTMIIIELSLVKDAVIQIVIKDNGIGFNARNMEQYGGIGLKSLLTRISYFNGILKLKSGKIFKTHFIINFPTLKSSNI